MRLSEAFSRYIQGEILAQNKSPKTYEGYRYTCGSFVEYFGDIKISKITPERIEEYYLQKTLKNTSDSVRGQIVQLRAVLKYCHLRGEKTCDISLIRIPKREKKIPKWLNRSEVERFIECAAMPKRGYAELNRIRNELLCRMLFESGARISEIIALDRSSIQSREFVAFGKSKAPRACYVGSETIKLMDKYLKMRTDSNPALFISIQTGERMTAGTAREVFRRISRDSGITGVHPHTMRHSFATFMLNSGAGIRDVCELLGHQNLDTTQKYTHLVNPQLKQLHSAIIS